MDDSSGDDVLVRKSRARWRASAANAISAASTAPTAPLRSSTGAHVLCCTKAGEALSSTMMQHFRDRPDRAPGKRARAGAGAGRELNLSKLREKKAGGPVSPRAV